MNQSTFVAMTTTFSNHLYCNKVKTTVLSNDPNSSNNGLQLFKDFSELK